MSKKEQDEEKTITPAGEVELTEEELEQIDGGGEIKWSTRCKEIDDIKPVKPGSRILR